MDDEVQRLIAAHLAARRAGDHAEGDRIRDYLLEQRGVAIPKVDRRQKKKAARGGTAGLSTLFHETLRPLGRAKSTGGADGGANRVRAAHRTFKQRDALGDEVLATLQLDSLVCDAAVAAAAAAAAAPAAATDAAPGAAAVAAAAAAERRRPCPRCGKKRAVYCFDCLTLLPGYSLPPLPRLPFRFLVLTHEKEPRSRSTGVHAAVLAPADVTLRTFYQDRKAAPGGGGCGGGGGDDADCLPPALFPAGRTFLLFPTNEAATVAEAVAAQQLAREQRQRQRREGRAMEPPGDVGGEGGGVDGDDDGDADDDDDERLVVVVVDSTWAQSKQILRHPSIQALPKLAVSAHRTAFWRRQTLGENYLSSIEAVYHLCREHDEHCSGGSGGCGGGGGDGGDGGGGNNPHRYDNLLALFVAIRDTIRQQKGGTPCPSEQGGGCCTKVSCQYLHGLLGDCD